MKRFVALAAGLVALATCAATGLTLGLTPATGRDWLILLGGSYEVASVLLIASPELGPRFLRAATWARLLASRTRDRLIAAVRRLFRRAQNVTVHVPAGGVVVSGGRVTARASCSPDATLEERVEYLLRRDQDIQARFDDLDERLDARVKSLRGQIEALVPQVMDEVSRRIREVQDAYINLRLIGVGILITGIVLSVWGSLS